MLYAVHKILKRGKTIKKSTKVWRRDRRDTEKYEGYEAANDTRKCAIYVS